MLLQPAIDLILGNRGLNLNRLPIKAFLTLFNDNCENITQTVATNWSALSIFFGH